MPQRKDKWHGMGRVQSYCRGRLGEPHKLGVKDYPAMAKSKGDTP